MSHLNFLSIIQLRTSPLRSKVCFIGSPLRADHALPSANNMGSGSHFERPTLAVSTDPGEGFKRSVVVRL